MTLTADPATATGFEWLTVRRVSRLCADAVAIEFAERRSFTAGQSLTVRRVIDGVDCRRTYSICAAEGESLRIGVREVPGGAVSRWLVHDLRPGDRMEVSGPGGRFTLVEPAAHHLCVAAGSGITPVLSIAAPALAAGGSVTLLHGNRTAASVMFAEQIADLKDAHPAAFISCTCSPASRAPPTSSPAASTPTGSHSCSRTSHRSASTTLGSAAHSRWWRQPAPCSLSSARLPTECMPSSSSSTSHHRHLLGCANR